MQHRFLTALLLGAGVVLCAHAPARAERASFDGTWSVRLVTEAGSCDSSYSYTIAIRDGQVRAVSGEGASGLSGGVRGDGSVALGIRSSIARADASGRLQAGSGSGTWRVSMLGCVGRWTARRSA